MTWQGLSYVYRFDGFGATVEGQGVATQSCPMGWQPSMDHLLLAGAVADVWFLKPKGSKQKRGIRAFRRAEVMINVQIDDAVIQSLWGPKHVCQKNASADILSFTPGEWRRNHGDYLVQGSFMNVIQPECFRLQGPDVSKASIISKKDAEKGNNFLLNRIKAHHAARMATLSGAKTTKKNFLCLNIAITRGIIIRKSLSSLLSVLGTLPRFGETMYDTLSRADGGLLAARDLGAYSCPCSCHFALICFKNLPNCLLLALLYSLDLHGEKGEFPSSFYYSYTTLIPN